MATEEEIYKIIAKVEGDSQVKQLGDELAKAEKKLADMIQMQGAGSVGAKHYAEEVAHLAASLKQADSAMQQSAGAMKQVEGGAGIASHKVMQLGQTLDDLQYVPEQGLRPIINNVMQLSPVLGIAMIAAQLLYTNWDNLAKLFGQGHTKSQAEEMEELGKKTEKTAEETAKLLKYEEMRAHVKAQEKPPEAKTKFGQDVDRAISEAPVDDVNKGLDKHFGKQIRAMAEVDPRTAEMQSRHAAEMRQAQDSVANAEPGSRTRALAEQDRQDVIDRHRQERDKIYGEAREKFRAGMSTDPDRARAVERAARANPGDFGPNGKQFAESLRDADPRQQQLAKEREARNDAEEAALKEQSAKEASQRKAVADQYKENKEAEKEWLEEEYRQAQAAAAEKDRKARKNQEVDDAVNQVQEDIKKQEDKDKEAQLKQAKETPGIEGLIKDRLKAMGGGAGAEKALAEMLTPKFGKDAAESLTKAGGVSARDELMSEWLKGPDSGPQRRSSQVIGAEGLANSIQSAVGGPDEQVEQLKKILEQQTRSAAALDKIAGAPAAGPTLRR